MVLTRGRGITSARGNSPARGCGGGPVRGRQFSSTSGRGRGRTSRGHSHPNQIRLDWDSFYRLGTTQNIPAAVNELLPETNGGESQWDTPVHGEEHDPHEDEYDDWDNQDDFHEPETPDPDSISPHSNRAATTEYHMPRSYPYQTNMRPTTEFGHGGSSSGINNLSKDAPSDSMQVDGSNNNDESQKVLIVPVGNKSFKPHEIIREIAARCITTDYRVGWTGMRDIPLEAFDRWFSRFCQIARWNPEYNVQVRQNFRCKCGEVIRYSWASVRAWRSKKGPAFSSPTILAANKLKWDTDPSFKALSEQNKQNCKGEKSGRGHSTHKGGPKPSEWHYDQLKLELQRLPTAREMYDRLQQKADGGYLDPEGHRMLARYEAKLKDRIDRGLTPIPVPANEDMEVFISEVGVTQRDKLPRVFGAPTTLVPGSQFRPHSSISSSSQHHQQAGAIDPAMVELMKSFRESIEMNLKTIVKETVQEALRSATCCPVAFSSPTTGVADNVPAFTVSEVPPSTDINMVGDT